MVHKDLLGFLKIFYCNFFFPRQVIHVFIDVGGSFEKRHAHRVHHITDFPQAPLKKSLPVANVKVDSFSSGSSNLTNNTQHTICNFYGIMQSPGSCGGLL